MNPEFSGQEAETALLNKLTLYIQEARFILNPTWSPVCVALISLPISKFLNIKISQRG